MINSYLSGKSPEKPAIRRIYPPSYSLMHLTCHQLLQLKINYDDVLLDGSILVNKVALCGQIISYREELSPQKKLMKILSVRDCSGLVLRGIQLYHGHDFWE